MGAGNHGGFGATKGMRNSGLPPMNLQFFASKAFEKGGHVSEESFANHREFFLGKSLAKLEAELKKQGYIVKRVKSKNKDSKARKLVVQNGTKVRNIATILVSPGSRRHGNIAYVKVSTNDAGVLKVVSDKSKYKSDGKETAKIYFARRK